ncbi:hypothetical protein M0R72_13795 [Candidatus Pacearchaeota archaeon]|nr:hypothetical protein [Candidatus Pacearchaeota archaeon]
MADRVCERCGLILPANSFRHDARSIHHGGFARKCRLCEMTIKQERLSRAIAEMQADRDRQQARHRARHRQLLEKVSAAQAVAG